jgi:hypothetical protein
MKTKGIIMKIPEDNLYTDSQTLYIPTKAPKIDDLTHVFIYKNERGNKTIIGDSVVKYTMRGLGMNLMEHVYVDSSKYHTPLRLIVMSPPDVYRLPIAWELLGLSDNNRAYRYIDDAVFSILQKEKRKQYQIANEWRE